MIQIGSEIIKTQPKFWNHAVFHPTDAVEDPWGRRILDKCAEDKALDSLRIYTMFEDIVYIGENGEICYDFRLSDLRLDYLVEKGYNLTLAFAGIPDCMADNLHAKTNNSKKHKRYKGKLWNTSPLKDEAPWEELCYVYTKHIVERYGLDTVKKWRMHCFNEPDWAPFFLSNLDQSREAVMARLAEYNRLYSAFQRGVRRVSEELQVGGPALAVELDFLEGWLDYVRENDLKLDFVTGHYYGGSPMSFNDKTECICVENLVKKHKIYTELVSKHGFSHLPLVIDEWGMASCGFFNRDECPDLMAREHEVFSAYFAKLIARYIEEDFKIEKLMICLSGQHEMKEDFTGFRNFFTLNFIKKPIYNAFVLSSRLGCGLLEYKKDNENLFAVPTKTDRGYAVLLTYSSETFEEEIPTLSEVIGFDEGILGKRVTVYCIDKSTTNPYRLFQKMGEPKDLSEEQLLILRAEGILKPTASFTATENRISLTFTPNSVFLVTVE